jgi:hypothetical protein
MFVSAKTRKLFVLALLSSMLLLSVASVEAQGQASVTIMDVLGGSTTPAAGTYSYNDGTAVSLTATPLDGYVFVQWQIVTAGGAMVDSDNPATLTVTGGVTYAIQPIFDIYQTVPGGVGITDFSKAAIIVIPPSSGGTTSPPPGTYALEDATQTQLTATPADGWQFAYWTVSGYPWDTEHGGDTFTGIETANPYTVDHGYGNTYSYQAVFTKIGQATPTPTGGGGGGTGAVMASTIDTVIIVVLVVVIIIILIALAVVMSRRKK